MRLMLWYFELRNRGNIQEKKPSSQGPNHLKWNATSFDHSLLLMTKNMWHAHIALTNARARKRTYRDVRLHGARAHSNFCWCLYVMYFVDARMQKLIASLVLYIIVIGQTNFMPHPSSQNKNNVISPFYQNKNKKNQQSIYSNHCYLILRNGLFN